jgi:hypothetical protein
MARDHVEGRAGRTAAAFLRQDLFEAPVGISAAQAVQRHGREPCRLTHRGAEPRVANVLLQPCGRAAQADARPAPRRVDVVRERDRKARSIVSRWRRRAFGADARAVDRADPGTTTRRESGRARRGDRFAPRRGQDGRSRPRARRRPVARRDRSAPRQRRCTARRRRSRAPSRRSSRAPSAHVVRRRPESSKRASHDPCEVHGSGLRVVAREDPVDVGRPLQGRALAGRSVIAQRFPAPFMVAGEGELSPTRSS